MPTPEVSATDLTDEQCENYRFKHWKSSNEMIRAIYADGRASIAQRSPAPAPGEREALAELVACKDLKDADALKIGAIQKRALMDEYERRKGPAWEAARRALAAPARTALTDEQIINALNAAGASPHWLRITLDEVRSVITALSTSPPTREPDLVEEAKADEIREAFGNFSDATLAGLAGADEAQIERIEQFILTECYPMHAGATASEPAASLPSIEPVAWRDVKAERQRQVSVEGWTPEHDDSHTPGALADAAACYAGAYSPMHSMPMDWPWEVNWWKPADRRRNLVKAGALILAEIERLDRASLPEMREGDPAETLAEEKTLPCRSGG